MTLQRPQATAYKSQGFKTIFYVDPVTNAEVNDVCTLDTGELIARRMRTKTVYGAENPWEVVYGQINEGKKEVDMLELDSNKNPTFIRQDTEKAWQWRVRNIPYPAQVYNITVDEEKNQIVIRTSNKKYFKRIDAPNNEKFDSSKVNWTWGYNTLVVTHDKPPRLISIEREEQKWRLSLPCKEEGEPDCNPQ